MWSVRRSVEVAEGARLYQPEQATCVYTPHGWISPNTVSIGRTRCNLTSLLLEQNDRPRRRHGIVAVIIIIAIAITIVIVVAFTAVTIAAVLVIVVIVLVAVAIAIVTIAHFG